MSRVQTVAIALILCAAGARSLWMTFTALAVATPIHMEAEGGQLERMQRYEGLARALTGLTRVGYIGGLNPAATEPYYFARLAALPTVVTLSDDEAVVIADMHSEEDVRQFLADQRWRVRHRLPDHLLVVERAP